MVTTTSDKFFFFSLCGENQAVKPVTEAFSKHV